VLGNGSVGIVVGGGAADNLIGGDTVDMRNVISGNSENGVQIQGEGTTSNRVLGNYIGTDARGTIALGNGSVGVIIISAADNLIGGDTADMGNVISGNSGNGMQIQGEGATGNQVLGNYIGTDASGIKALSNGGRVGIVIMTGAADNTIGGESPGTGNLISGNAGHGIQIQDAGTTGNQILGNYIGTDITGTMALGNDLDGVSIIGGAADNTIGGETPGTGNLISGNAGHGILIQDVGTTGNQVLGNYIGTDARGIMALGNSLCGIIILWGAADNNIGGDTPGAKNVISGNAELGVGIQDMGTTGNRIAGNYIGTDAMGIRALGNGSVGVVIMAGAADNIIGSDTVGGGNLISGNAEVGVQIQDVGTTGNQVLGNYIGTDINGLAALGNGLIGVSIMSGAADNLIGGDTPGTGNLISGNVGVGVGIQGVGTTDNHVIGNYIGTDASGIIRLSNGLSGVAIADGAADNIIGGDDPNAGNLISGNAEHGILIQDVGTAGNQVIGNYIGTDVSGLMALGNDSDGIVIMGGATANIIGGDIAGARNIISGNGGLGLLIQNEGTTDNQVLGNYIGADASGRSVLGNDLIGIAMVLGASDNYIGGSTPGAGNFISDNGDTGVWIGNARTTHNQVAGNKIVSNTLSGAYIGDGTHENTVGVSNTIAHNGQNGVVISGTTTLKNKITRNRIYDNGGFPIKFVLAPIATAWELTPTQCSGNAVLPVSGYACVNCQIEVYGNPTSALEGTMFLAETTAGADGNFSLNVPCMVTLPYLAATATDPEGTTWGFFSGTSASMHAIFLPLVVRGDGTGSP
jgi:titin